MLNLNKFIENKQLNCCFRACGMFTVTYLFVFELYSMLGSQVLIVNAQTYLTLIIILLKFKKGACLLAKTNIYKRVATTGYFEILQKLSTCQCCQANNLKLRN